MLKEQRAGDGFGSYEGDERKTYKSSENQIQGVEVSSTKVKDQRGGEVSGTKATDGEDFALVAKGVSPQERNHTSLGIQKTNFDISDSEVDENEKRASTSSQRTLGILNLRTCSILVAVCIFLFVMAMMIAFL